MTHIRNRWRQHAIRYTEETRVFRDVTVGLRVYANGQTIVDVLIPPLHGESIAVDYDMFAFIRGKQKDSATYNAVYADPHPDDPEHPFYLKDVVSVSPYMQLIV